MTALVALLVAIAVLEGAAVASAVPPRRALGALVDLNGRLARSSRVAPLLAPLDRLLARLDARAAPSAGRAILELQAASVAGALLGAVAGGPVLAVPCAAALSAARLACLVGRAARREAATLRDLPLVLDLLAMGVEGGLPVGAALDLAARRGPAGPLREALRLVIASTAAGRTRAESVGELARSLPYPPIAALVATIAQADRLGGRLAPALRAQALQRRTERWHQAERRALLAPVRLLLPLALCILPATFVVLLVPLALRLAGELSP